MADDQKIIYNEDYMRIVEDTSMEYPTLYIADDLDETEVNLTVEELTRMLPILQDWVRRNTH